MLRSPVIWLLAAVVLGGCSASSASYGPTPLPEQPGCPVGAAQRALCVVVLGDSLAAGVPLDGDDRWWVRLERGLGSALPDRTVHIDSWAVPGARVDVLEAAASSQPRLGSYDIAIVIEGVNDEPFMATEEWAARYEGAIAAIEGHGPMAILVAPPPSFENGQFQTRYDSVAEGVRHVAANGRALLDIAAAWKSVGPAVAARYYADLIHQSAVGQRRMAELALDAVLTAIDQPQAQ